MKPSPLSWTLLATLSLGITALAQPGGKRPAGGPNNLTLSVAGGQPLPLRHVEGGDTFLDPEPGGTSRQVNFRPRVEPLQLSASVAALLSSKEGADWLKAQVSGAAAGARGVNGAVTVLSFDSQPQSELAFTAALTTEFSIGPLDAGSKEPLYCHVTMLPEASSWNLKPAGGKQASAKPTQKAALASNFRVTLPDMPTTRIVRVDGIGASASVAATGTDRGRATGVWKPERVRLTVSATDMGAYVTWLHEAAAGKATATAGKALQVDLLDAGMKEVALTLTADNARIIRASMNFGQAGSDAAPTGEVELMVDGWEAK